MNNNILDINSVISFDENITRYEQHSYGPLTSISVDSADNIIISVNQESAYLLISESGIYVEGKITKENGDVLNLPTDSSIEFINNGLCFLFSEIRFEVNAVEVDTCKNVGITSTIKAYPSYSQNESKKYEVAGWGKNSLINKSDHTFSGYIPLKFIFGFAETYDKIILNQRLDLILTRAKNSKNALYSTSVSDAKVQLNKILWKIPHIHVNDSIRLDLLSRYKKNIPINIAFRKWNLNYYPNIPQTKDGQWVVKTSNSLERPRYILLGFQSDRENNFAKDMSKFDHVKLRNLKVYLNSDVYPYENLNLEIAKKRYLPLYIMYCNFQESYYGKVSEPFLDYEDFLNKAPLCVIDTSRQAELWKHSSAVDIRIEYELESNAPANTNLFALIIHDSLLKLYPLTNTIQKVL